MSLSFLPSLTKQVLTKILTSQAAFSCAKMPTRGLVIHTSLKSSFPPPNINDIGVIIYHISVVINNRAGSATGCLPKQ